MPKAVTKQVQNDEAHEEDEMTPEITLDNRSEGLMDRLFSPKEKVVHPERIENSDDVESGDEEEIEEEEETEDEETEEEDTDDTESGDGDESDDEEESDDADYDGDDSRPGDKNSKESVAQRLAKENGRKAKELDARLKETNLELEKLRDERDRLAQEAEQLRAVKLKPTDHPEYKNLRHEILQDVEQAAEVLPLKNPSTLSRKFGELIADYLDITELSGDERSQKLHDLRAKIHNEVSGSDIEYGDMDDDERRHADGLTSEVLKVVQRNVGKTKQLQKIAKDLSEKSEIASLTANQQSYQRSVDEFQPILDSIGDMPDEVIEENPHHIESVVARMVKESPVAKKRLDSAKRDVLEILTGPKVLTRDEIKKLEANGTDIKEFIKNREKAFDEKRKKLLPMLVQGLVTRATFRETLEELSKFKDAAREEDVEFDALRRITKKKPTKKKQDADYVPPSKRPNPLDKIFGPED